MKRNLLQEVISDAKMVKEVAIANAKKALEESINPTLKSMLVAKLEEMDRGDEGIEENEEASFEEELDLDEVLKELEDSDLTEEEENEEEEEEEEEGEDGNDDDEDINIEDMTDEDLSKFIQDEIEDMVASGELEPGENFESEEGEEGEEGEEEDFDFSLEDEGEDDEVDMDNLDDEIQEILREIEMEDDGIEVESSCDGDSESLKVKIQNAMSGLDNSEQEEEMPDLQLELNEAYKVIKVLKKDLNEINLLNSKLLYTNKIFKGSRGLKETQMIKILEAFDRAKTVKEARLVYTTLKENINNQKSTKPSKIQENLMSSASRSLKGRGSKTPIFESESMVDRFQHLAGIK